MFVADEEVIGMPGIGLDVGSLENAGEGDEAVGGGMVSLGCHEAHTGKDDVYDGTLSLTVPTRAVSKPLFAWIGIRAPLDKSTLMLFLPEEEREDHSQIGFSLLQTGSLFLSLSLSVSLSTVSLQTQSRTVPMEKVTINSTRATHGRGASSWATKTKTSRFSR
jgi:hypothetical protein